MAPLGTLVLCSYINGGSPCIITQMICLSPNHVKNLDTLQVLSITLVIRFASKLFLQTTVKFYTVPYYAQHLTQIIRTSEPWKTFLRERDVDGTIHRAEIIQRIKDSESVTDQYLVKFGDGEREEVMGYNLL